MISYLSSIFCFNDKTDYKSDIVLFNNSSLSNCQKILKARRDQKLKYSTVGLPELPDIIHGYQKALSKIRRDKIMCKRNRCY